MTDENQLQPSLSKEEKEIDEIIKKSDRFPKLTRWTQLFFDKQNKFELKTWGNATQSAIYAYSLDPNDPKQYATASSIGHQNFRKLQFHASIYYEQQGLTTGKILDLLAAKAVDTNNAVYLKILLEITGIYSPKPSVAIQNNTQINNQQPVQVSPEEQKRIANEFEEFLDWKYGSPWAKKVPVSPPQE